MTFKSTMWPAFGAALDGAFAEAVTQLVCTYEKATAWDPVTEAGAVEVVTYSGRGVMTQFETSRIDGLNIQATDTKLIVLADEIEEMPAAGHTINGFSVKNVRPDPAGVHYEIQLRAV
ncbi:hypothetical protein [Pseudomonas sp. RC10]|uniref:hypothetical protein n=1 Tax=Pseudomonas bambusae TaxID=3139142 RepID=UPI003139F61C